MCIYNTDILYCLSFPMFSFFWLLRQILPPSLSLSLSLSISLSLSRISSTSIRFNRISIVPDGSNYQSGKCWQDQDARCSKQHQWTCENTFIEIVNVKMDLAKIVTFYSTMNVCSHVTFDSWTLPIGQPSQVIRSFDDVMWFEMMCLASREVNFSFSCYPFFWTEGINN